MGTKTPGRRIQPPPDSWEDGLDPTLPGDYWRDAAGDWRGVTPNGLPVWLKNHHVDEHPTDGTISVVAGPWGSNSILASNGTGNKSWHGYIHRGEWQEV